MQGRGQRAWKEAHGVDGARNKVVHEGGLGLVGLRVGRGLAGDGHGRVG